MTEYIETLFQIIEMQQSLIKRMLDVIEQHEAFEEEARDIADRISKEV